MVKTKKFLLRNKSVIQNYLKEHPNKMLLFSFWDRVIFVYTIDREELRRVKKLIREFIRNKYNNGDIKFMVRISITYQGLDVHIDYYNKKENTNPYFANWQTWEKSLCLDIKQIEVVKA